MSRWFIDHTVSTGSLSNTSCKNLSIKRGLRYHRRVYKLLESHLSAETEFQQQLHVEPWLRHSVTKQLLQPDAVIVDDATSTGLVVEVKLNWKDGRDEKLLKQYLPAVQSAFDLAAVWPVLITSNVTGLKYKPLLGLTALLDCDAWEPGADTPVLLLP